MNQNKKNNEEKKSSRIWFTSFIPFLIIATLNSCNEAHVRREQEAKQILQVPEITWSEVFDEEMQLQKIDEIIKDMEEETEEEEEIEEEAVQFHK